MTNTKAIQTVQAVETLFKDVMSLYWEYLSFLEDLVKRIPKTEKNTLLEIQEHVVEIQEAMDHDIGIFERVANEDGEGINKFQDDLKIQDIYKNLKQ